MEDLNTSVAIFGKPYTLTKSRLGAVTKLFENRYICDPNALSELFHNLGEKIVSLKPINVGFSFLISFSDKTHYDGIIKDLENFKQIAIGKETERVVLKWIIRSTVGTEENETSVIVRITNPLNPLLFLQAALSKSVNDIDNLEFEMGSTCVTVDGAGQMFSEEIFLLIQKWIDARNKPHPFISVGDFYKKNEYLIDQIGVVILPSIVTLLFSILIYKISKIELKLALIPLAFASYQAISSYAKRINSKMERWAEKSKCSSMFILTNGDFDSVTKMIAKSKNSSIKLIVSWIVNISLNIIATILCCYVFHINYKKLPNNCFNLSRLLSRNLLVATLGKFHANIRLAG